MVEYGSDSSEGGVSIGHRDYSASPTVSITAADDLRTHEGFPTDVADSLAMIAAQDVAGYVLAVESVLESFETREEHLEDIPVADTVVVLQTLAARRNMAADLESALLPD